jgi:signal transduction histidine kinase
MLRLGHLEMAGGMDEHAFLSTPLRPFEFFARASSVIGCYADAMRRVFVRPWGLIAGCGLLLGAPNQSPGAQDVSPPSSPALPVVTNMLQFDLLAERTEHATFALHLEGIVRWANKDGSLLAVQDDSGAALLETEPKNPRIEPGQKVLVEGDGAVNGSGADVRIGGRLLVNNDGAHSEQEKSAAVFLKAGRHPLCVSWLAGGSPEDLEVCFQGPDLPRQKIPDTALLRKVVEPASGAVQWIHGLDYQVFQGQWPGLPDFHPLVPVKTGAANNFDLTVKTQDKNVALRFAGWLEVPRNGLYTFSLASAGGSRLFIGLPRIQRLGVAELPAPCYFTLGEVLPSKVKSAWAEMEGLVSFVSRKGLTGYQLELSSETGRLRVSVDEGAGISPELLLGSRVRVRGICRSAYTVDGQATAGVMWTPGSNEVNVLETASKRWQVENTNVESGPLPVLTTLGQIMHLKREEAIRGYPVNVRGVIVWSGGDTCQICDSTGGIYVDAREITDKNSLPLRAGEYREIEGHTELRFSPVIVARRAVRLGLGALPEPAQPTMDQLLNGTLDAQYVEIEGIVTAVQTNRLTLLTRGGKIQVYLVPPMWDGEPSVLIPSDASIQEDWSQIHLAALKAYDGALVCVRGSLSPVKNPVTLQFKVGEIQMRAASVSVERPAPANPFDAPAKRAVELLMFDAQANAFQPVKVTGQIVQERAGEYYLMDGNQGLRFTLKKPVALAIGDVVEVVGYPELRGPSPGLREADAHKIGTAPLPRPQRMFPGAPLVLNAGYDSTRVELQARLMNLSLERNEQVLGLQMGSHFFLARLDKGNGSADSVPVGSLLDLTGVYVGHVSAPGLAVDSFELLLDSPADIRVLDRPSWWTLTRLASVVGVLLGVILAASLWIGLLHRQVEQRSAQLRREIHEREQVEHRHAVEAERSRIARDLHDDLGSSLTEISLLADAGPGAPPSLERAGSRFHLISGKARSLINALDVIVWLVNPQKDSLPFLASYLGGYAKEYLSASAMACRLKIPLDLPPLPLNAEIRHGLFLAVKEILNNVVRHARASEVILELSAKNRELRISVADNGCGFDPTAADGGNGLHNLRERLTRLGGQCHIRSQPGKGTAVSLILPLASGLPPVE